MARASVPDDDQDQVLLRSRRRCCICSGLDGDLRQKQGQIAHLDHNNANADPDNLAFLCLLHHDRYDGKTSQSKALRESEVKQFRKELYDKIAAGLPVAPNLQLESVSPGAKPQPNIKVVGAKDADVYHSDDTIFHETRRGLGDFKVTIVCFRNEGIEGRRVPSVDVRAHVIYRDANGQEITDLPSGVWLEEYEGHIDLLLGKKQCLILFLLTNQGTLKKIWKEAYRHEKSWMSGRPSYRVKDEVIRARVATVEIHLLSECADICVLKRVFKVGEYEDGVLPKLTELRTDLEGVEGERLARRVTEITLEADYIGRDSQSCTFPCQSVSELPGRYKDDTSADGRVERSTIEHPAVVVKGIDAKAVEELGWNPTRLRFKETKTDESKGFSGEVRSTLEPDTLKFVIYERLDGDGA